MKNLRTIMYAGLIAAVSGCATSQIPVTEAQQVGSSQILSQLTTTTQDPAHCVFVRDTGFLGSANYVVISINEMPAAKLGAGEKVIVDLDPGEYIFSAGYSMTLGMSNPVVLEQSVASGKTYTYRISTDLNNGMQIHRTMR